MRQSGYQEVIGYTKAGLDLLSSAPDTSERAEAELTLRLNLSLSLAAVHGYADPQVAEAFDRARVLCRRTGKPPLLMQALSGLWVFHLMRGDLNNALELSKEMVNVASRVKDPLLIAEGHVCAGVAYFYLGNFVSAQSHFEKSLRVQSREGAQSSVLSFGWDTRVVSLTYGAANLWLLGSLGKDLRFNQLGESLAEEISHPLNLVIARGMLAGHHQFRRESSHCLRSAERALSLATEYSFTHWIASASITSGWGLATTGHLQEGISRSKQGLELWRKTGAQAELPRFLGLLTDAYLTANRIKEGLDSVAEALRVMEETNERFYEAELYRLKAELLLKAKNGRDRAREIEACYLKAVDVARRQKAKSFELRATISLCRFWQRTGKEKEAKKRLSNIYNWFAGRFDTEDIKEGKTLLHQLSLLMLAVRNYLLPELFEWQAFFI